jgi:hypothetical protein
MNMDGFPVHVNRNRANRADGNDANCFATSQPLSHHAARRGAAQWTLTLVLPGRLHC